MELQTLFRLLPSVPAIKTGSCRTLVLERDPVMLSPQPTARPKFELDGFIPLGTPFLSADFLAEVRE